MLDENGIQYEVIDLTDNETEMNRLKNETGWRTFPIIMIDGKLVGGYTDLKELDQTGQLDHLKN